MHKDTFRQIAIDVPRMSPLVGLFQQRLVQEMVERILYIWAIRSPLTSLLFCILCFEGIENVSENVVVVTVMMCNNSVLVYGLRCAGTLPLAMSRVLTTSSLLSSWFSFRFSPFLIAIIFFNAPFYAKDFVEVDVTRVSFEFSDLESSVRENVEADSFWCMTKVILKIENPNIIYDFDFVSVKCFS